jgi:hypothetical protein
MYIAWLSEENMKSQPVPTRLGFHHRPGVAGVEPEPDAGGAVAPSQIVVLGGSTLGAAQATCEAHSIDHTIQEMTRTTAAFRFIAPFLMLVFMFSLARIADSTPLFQPALRAHDNARRATCAPLQDPARNCRSTCTATYITLGESRDARKSIKIAKSRSCVSRLH